MEYLRTHGPWVFSLAAFAQFWIWFFLRSIGRRKRLELFESGSVEIGFDANGPLIALAGVIRPAEKEVFVQSMELTVVCEKDKTKRDFRWLAFKPNFLMPATVARAWEMPHPFLIAPGDTHKFNIVFHDTGAFHDIKGILQHYYHQWHDTERRITERRVRRQPSEGDGPVPDDLINEFKHQEICVTSYTELNRKCYWEQGSYSLSIKVLTENGKQDICKQFRFSLNKMDAKTLKTNCVVMMEEPIAAASARPVAACQVVQAEFATSDAH